MYYYKLIDRDTGEHYIGSCKNMKTRMYCHTAKKKQCYSRKIIEQDNYDIIILEMTDEYHTATREQYWRDKHPNRINKYNAKRKISKKEYNKKWANDRNNWVRSWGDPRNKNCLLLIDISIFS